MSSPRSCPSCLARYRTEYAICPRDGADLVTDDVDPLIGTIIDDRYYVDELLGEGALGAVYRARHVRLGRAFAMKVPFGDVALDSSMRQRFVAEAEAACRLAHPNVVAVLDVGETPGGLPFLVMDLAEGRSLDTLLEAGRLPADQALRIVGQIARGLAHAHHLGLIHRDLKPGNVIVDPSGRARIVDFGIALFSGVQRLTERGLLVGTPAYMAPEQALGEPLDGRADLFALGLIAYELLTGRLPHDGGPLEILRKYIEEPIPSVRDRAPEIVLAQPVEDLLAWMLQRDPTARPPDADAVVAAIERILATPRPRSRSRRHRVAMMPLRRSSTFPVPT